jgi:hypothetical protein
MDDVTDLKGLKFPEKKSDNPPTLICGHGGELCNDDGSLQILDIPENCMLITFADCGLTYGALTIYNAIVKNEKNLHYFEDPIKHKDDLERIFNRKIHIHHPNAKNETSRTYVNTHYRLIGDHTDKDDICVIQLSGLVPLEKKYVNKILVTESHPFKCTKDHSWDMFYSASIYPTKNQVAPIFGRKLANTLPKLVEKIPVVTQQFLFEKRPGIYFNPLCRVNDCDVKSVINRQYKSSRALNRNINTEEDYIIQMIENCVEFKDCSLFKKKRGIIKDLDRSALNKIRDSVVGRAKHFKYEDSKTYKTILKYIDDIISEKEFVNISSENINNNNFRTIQLPNRPKKQSFNYNLVKVGSARRRTRKNKKK